jgi:DNA polymerase III epsilon subunit-like protein
MESVQTDGSAHARDAFLLALSMNDRAAFAGQKLPFNKVGLASLCNRFHVTNENPHDALSDALAEAEVYRAMITMDLF